MAPAHSERSAARSPHKLAEKLAKNAGVDLDDWIDEAIAEYAEDLGVAPGELTERERLEAIEDRIDRLARVDSRSDRGGASRRPESPPNPRSRRESLRAPAESPRARFDDEDAPRSFSPRADDDRLERAIETIERRAERNEERTARALESLSGLVSNRGFDGSRLEQAVADIEKRAQRNEVRTTAALESLQDVVAGRGGERERLVQAVAEVETRAQRNADRTAKALESLSQMVAARDEERERIEIAIERANKRSEESETRAARAFESLSAIVAKPPAPRLASPRADVADPVSARLDQLSRRAGAPSASAPDNDDETLRLVSERLARRRSRSEARETREPAPDLSGALGDLRRDLRMLGEKVDQLSGATVGNGALETLRAQTRDVERALSGAAEKVAGAERMQSQIVGLVERVEKLAAARPASAEMAQALKALADAHAKIDRESPAKALKAVEQQLGELGARVEAAARRPASDSRAIEDLSRRIETLRAAVESPSRPQGDAFAAALAALNEKLDQAAASGSQSVAGLSALAKMVGRLEEEVRRPAAVSLDPQPLEDIARRIDGVHGRLGPKVEGLQARIDELSRKLDSNASTPQMEAVEAALRRMAAKVEEGARATDTKPFEAIARRIEGAQGELAPKVEDLQGALDALVRKLDRTPTTATEFARIEEALGDILARVDHTAFQPQMEAVEAALRRVAANVEETAARNAPRVDDIHAALGELSRKLDRPMPQIEAVDATLRRLASKFEEASARPATVSLDARPIEDLARRIESVRASLESSPSFNPQVERLETALGLVADKLDRAAPVDSQGLNSTLAEMNRRLEEAFRQPSEFGRGPIDALAAQIEAVRETVERHAEQFGGAEAAVKTLAARLERSGGFDQARLEMLLADVVDRLDASGSAPSDLTPLADAVAAIGQKLDRMNPGDISALAAALARGLDRIDHVEDLAERDARLEILVRDVGQRLEGVETRLTSPTGSDNGNIEHAVRELTEKVAELRTASDTRAVEQDVRSLHDKLDDLAERRFVASARESTVGAAPEVLIDHLLDIQERLDKLAAMRMAPAALDDAVGELGEQMDALRATREAAAREASTVADLRADQAILDRRLDARFSSLQDVLEKLVDRIGRIERDPLAEFLRPAAAPASAPRPTLSDIPDRDLSLRAQALETPLVAPPQRTREEPLAKSAAVNAHIAAARRLANAAADAETRPLPGASAASERRGIAFVQRAQMLLGANSRPVLLGAAGALTLLTGFAAYELRGHHSVHQSELEAPATSATTMGQAAPELDETPTGAVASAPQVIAAPLPAPSPSPALVASIPISVGPAHVAAATRGDVGAEVELAQRYLEGRTVARDPKAAADWLQAAADAGSAFANYRLGAMYEKGVGVAKDAGRARAFYALAADAGSARAMHNLAVLFAQDGGQGKPDYAAAIDWFRKAGTYGVRDSQFNLGVLYGRGLGATQDLAQSWLWFSLAARQGDTDAAHKRDEVALRMDGRVMATAKKLLEDFKSLTPDPAVNDQPAAPPAAADAAPDKKDTKRPV